jgi:predicted  nucleic acid-binding Zn-ribbon protein
MDIISLGFKIAIACVVILTIYAAWAARSQQGADEKKRFKELSKDQEIRDKKQQIERLKAELADLRKEMEKLKSTSLTTESELENTRKREQELKGSLGKREEWVKKDQEFVAKIKEERDNLEKELKQKEKELTEVFSKNVDLTRDIRDISLNTQALEQEIKEKSESIEILRHKLEWHAEESKKREDNIRGLEKTIAGIKKASEESEWVPKKEFNALNEEYSKLEEELATLEERFKSKEDKIKELNEQLLELSAHPVSRPASAPEATEKKTESESPSPEKSVIPESAVPEPLAPEGESRQLPPRFLSVKPLGRRYRRSRNKLLSLLPRKSRLLKNRLLMFPRLRRQSFLLRLCLKKQLSPKSQRILGRQRKPRRKRSLPAGWK